MNRLSKQQRIRIITALVEGNSLRAVARMCDVSFNTVLKLVPQIGIACADYQDKSLRNLSCKLIQWDEIWSFVGSKEKNTRPSARAKDGATFGHTDGHRVYLQAVEDAFGSQIDYAMLVKVYGNDAESETRYSPAEWIGSQSVAIMGNPEPANISTSYVERQNLTMRMSMRRFTRLTNGFSKKIQNHFFAISLHYMMHYNFCRIHKTLRVTPAMAAGVTDRV